MPYDPSIHHRRSIRLNEYDYSQEGLYFITICLHNKQCLLGKITNGEMMLNQYGQISFNEWMNLPKRFPNIILDVFQIMPNHIHAIFALNSVGAYKSLVAKKCLEICKWNGEKLGKFWQRNYYEHIIRDNQSYNHIADCIVKNRERAN